MSHYPKSFMASAPGETLFEPERADRGIVTGWTPEQQAQIDANRPTGGCPVVPGAPDPNGFVVKDSGKREDFDSGMRRDTEDGKPDFTLIRRGPMFKRWAEHLTKGAVKYGRHNWTCANSEAELERFERSAARHFEQWLDGERDEDHAAAVMFNVNAAEYVRDRLETQRAIAGLSACGSEMDYEDDNLDLGP